MGDDEASSTTSLSRNTEAEERNGVDTALELVDKSQAIKLNGISKQHGYMSDGSRHSQSPPRSPSARPHQPASRPVERRTPVVRTCIFRPFVIIAPMPAPSENSPHTNAAAQPAPASCTKLPVHQMKGQPHTRKEAKCNGDAPGGPNLIGRTDTRRSIGSEYVNRTTKTEVPWPPAGSEDGLFCLCQQPYEGEFMVLCQSCNEWYHPACNGITKTEVTYSTKFICQTCKKMEDLVRARRGECQSINANGRRSVGSRGADSPKDPEPSDRSTASSQPSHSGGGSDVGISNHFSKDQSPIDPLPILEAAVVQLLESGATTLRELSVLERSPSIPWDAMQQKGRHWKRDVIRAVYLKCRPKEVPKIYNGMTASTSNSEDRSSEDAPTPKRARSTALQGSDAEQTTEAEQLSSPETQIQCKMKVRKNKLLGQRTRPTTQAAQFKRELRKSQSEDEIEDEIEGSVHCVCRKTWDGSFMVRCDGCRVWYHPRCIGLTRLDCDHPGHFYCPKCSHW